jgi:hypothetical protein
MEVSQQNPSQAETLILQKLQPYKDRIAELEQSIQDKENEAIILRLAAQRLNDIINKSMKKGPSNSGRKVSSRKRGKPGRR